MNARICSALLLFALVLIGAPAHALVILNYHDVRDGIPELTARDSDAISTDNLIANFDWLAGHGYTVVSLDQLLATEHGGPALPDKAVMLTFDDGLESFYTRVYPLLRAYRYPAILAVTGAWMDLKPGERLAYNDSDCDRSCFVTWPQVREMEASGLVEIASHSYGLHRGVSGNPQGNVLPAATTRIYDPATHTYESEAQQLARVRADLERSAQEIEANAGKRPRAIVWPYGEYNEPNREIAAQLGMATSFDLSDKLPVASLGHSYSRTLLTNNPTFIDLANELRKPQRLPIVRAVQVDLDYIYDPDPAQQERNLSALLDRIKSMGANAVWLQAYADPDGDGVADAVYFPNRHLPMRADLFSRVAWQLETRDNVKVYAWLPVLAFRFPPGALPSNAVLQTPGNDIDTRRLSPYDSQVTQMIGDVYADLAANANVDGVLFGDDAFLRDTDRIAGAPSTDTAQRTQALIGFTQTLADRMRRWRPRLETARNLFAGPVLDPRAQQWWAQSLPAFLHAYDYVALLAMPELEHASNADRWLRTLATDVAATPGGLEHTVFELATVDWRAQHRPIPAATLVHRMELLQSLGARHLAYYPDDPPRDLPPLQKIRPGISASTFPYPVK